MAFKMKNPCWDNYKMVGTKKKGGKTVPNCVPFKMNRPAFKQTDPPIKEKKSSVQSDYFDTVGFDKSTLEFDKKGNRIQQIGKEFYNSAERVDYSTLSDKQKNALNMHELDESQMNERLYSSEGKLYFDQGSYIVDDLQQVEPLMISDDYGNNTSTNEPTIASNEVDDSQSDFGARTFRVDGLRSDQTFSPNNPYTKDIKGNRISDRNILTPARRWERTNNSTQTRSESNRFGKSN